MCGQKLRHSISSSVLQPDELKIQCSFASALPESQHFFRIRNKCKVCRSSKICYLFQELSRETHVDLWVGVSVCVCLVFACSDSVMQGSDLFALDCPSQVKPVPVGPLCESLIFKGNSFKSSFWYRGSHNPLCTTEKKEKHAQKLLIWHSPKTYFLLCVLKTAGRSVFPSVTRLYNTC